ncbi:carbohydrate ABC transporter membrane protein 2 (CUT1 family) [Paenibacillus taihuensis]|uniref:Carbohydrate ABC transporter membrane protein 2 (CUT1 family) n=1 Tax=Paenibacillus taihuensis TaxID=1156355 RepID=A0A3D9S4P5_9BACL|nr:carbohydrate ABC transporter permease [Paenibacillus taihuensis]REE85171.1 carbohydrate ABC transporter membrane protein 2 (CUT1 family) [Paenibacillus taihuensis]
MSSDVQLASVYTEEQKEIRIGVRRRSAGSYVLDASLLVLSFLMLSPFLWIISTSLRLPKDSFSLPPAIFPTDFNFNNYAEVFNRVPFADFIGNSLKISLLIVVGHIFISSMAAFAFSRISFPGRNLIFIIFLAGLMIPGQVTIIPQFILISRLGLIDTHWALILPALINPLGIFMIRQMMMTISSTYDEAAYMDGASRMWVFLKVILPMVFPAIAVTSVMTFIANWNDFFRPLIFLNTFEKMTLPLGMTVLTGTFGSGNLSAILAGVTLSLVVPLLFYIFGQKYLVEGITAGGLKL